MFRPVASCGVLLPQLPELWTVWGCYNSTRFSIAAAGAVVCIINNSPERKQSHLPMPRICATKCLTMWKKPRRRGLARRAGEHVFIWSLSREMSLRSGPVRRYTTRLPARPSFSRRRPPPSEGRRGKNTNHVGGCCIANPRRPQAIGGMAKGTARTGRQPRSVRRGRLPAPLSLCWHCCPRGNSQRRNPPSMTPFSSS